MREQKHTQQSLTYRWNIRSLHSLNSEQFSGETSRRYSSFSRKDAETKRRTHNASDERRGENDNFWRWSSYDWLERYSTCRLEAVDDWLLIKLSIYIFSEIHSDSMFAFNWQGSVFSGVSTKSHQLLSLELRAHVFGQSVAIPWDIGLIFDLKLFVFMNFPQFSGKAPGIGNWLLDE